MIRPRRSGSAACWRGSGRWRRQGDGGGIATRATAASATLRSVLSDTEPPAESDTPARPQRVFAVDATASREAAWSAARLVTDALAKTLPSERVVALAVHGGPRAYVHRIHQRRQHAA